jgi:aspartate-semialdehyde dehydrogenase
MVGSVLIERMTEENDFKHIKAYFFSTSNINSLTPYSFSQNQYLLDAYDISELINMECIVTTHGSEYTNYILPKLKEHGYTGYFIDASSALRMYPDTIIALDPVNKSLILDGLKRGIKNYVGGNCSITLSMIGLSSLFKQNLIEWISIMTYQAASGAGAKHVRELLKQILYVSENNTKLIIDPNIQILQLIQNVNESIKNSNYPILVFYQ